MMPADASAIEELPTPEALLTPEHDPEPEEGAEAAEATEIAQTVAHWEQPSSPPPRKNRPPVSLRVTD